MFPNTPVFSPCVVLQTPLGVQNSRLVGHLLNADGDGRCSSVALLLKYWARVHQLSGTGRLTNYALLLLLLGYLQHSLLPPVARYVLLPLVASCRAWLPLYDLPITSWHHGIC